MKYIYKNNEGEREVELERWAWELCYIPNSEQIDRALAKYDERNAKLREERAVELTEAIKKGNLAEVQAKIMTKYANQLCVPVKPEMDALQQFDSEGIFHRISEIDQKNIYIISLYKTDDPKRRIDILWREGMQLIHKVVGVRPSGQEKFQRVYCFGYKYEQREYLNYVLPDDRIIMSPDQGVELAELVR